MRRIFLLLSLSGALSSCCIFHKVTRVGENAGQEPLIEYILLDFKNSKGICVYELNPVSNIVNKQICSYPIQKEYDCLDVYYKHVVEFLLSDSTLYEKNYIPIKQPFYPTLAFKPNKTGSVSCMFSFGTEEIAISNNDSTYVTYRIKNIQSFKRLYDEIKENKK